jgi:3-oxoacyl-[acyl-carrier protein] reductase
MKIELAGKTALVTGAGNGIGQAIADAMAQNGARVIYTDINAPAATAAAARSEGCQALEMDITNAEQVSAAIDQTLQEYGSLDILVNNAGVNTLAHRVTIDEFPKEEWDRIINVDLNGLFQVSQIGARAMKKQGHGRIINIASIAGLVPLRLQCAFIAAKAGVVNLTRAMAIELAPSGILVNAIAPGSTLTDGTRDLFYGDDGKFKESMQELLDHIPLGRPAEVEEIAQGALFLADPDNTYLTGHILVIDGGWTSGYLRSF